MLKGLYDFAPISPKTLGFKLEENLLYLSGVDRDENWLRVSNSKGQIGLVPINYVDVDSQVSGGAVLDFLDESLQVARRQKSRFLQELQEIRRSILNPINDLECRLAEFQSLINHLKAKGSPFCNRNNSQTDQSKHSHGSTKANGKSSNNVVNCYQSQELGPGRLDLDLDPDLNYDDDTASTRNYSPSFKTCDDNQSQNQNQLQHQNCRNHEQRSSRNYQKQPSNNYNTCELYQGDFFRSRCSPSGSFDAVSQNNGHYKPLKKSQSNTFVQFVNPIHDNESQHGCFKMSGDTCSVRSCKNNKYGDFSDNNYEVNSGSGGSTVTYTCSTGRKVKQLRQKFDGGASIKTNKSERNKKPSLASSPKEIFEPNHHHQNQPSLTKTKSKTEHKQQLLGSQVSRNSCNQKIAQDQQDSHQVCEIIEKVRQSTGMSHEVSQKAVQTVLRYLKDNSSGSTDVDRESTLNVFLRQLESPSLIHQPPSFIRSSVDFERLYLILCELSAQAQDDELWEVQEFESTKNLLEELNQRLDGADERIIITALEEDDYRNVHCLALYYQKEHSWSSRKHLIQSFAKISSIDSKALSVLLNSVLPLELAREILDFRSTKEDKDNRLETAGSLLGLLLSTGEKLPVRHLEFLGKDFINFVLDKIDESCTAGGSTTGIEGSSSSELPNVLFNLILAYNLQFGPHDENLVIATLASRRNAKFLTQKIVHLLLWEQDPISVINESPGSQNLYSKCSDSVLKLVLEMFSCSMIADLFYTNDTKVLIDIVVRSLTDWEPGEKKRTLYLQLIRMIIRNSNFRDHNHRRDDLVKIFTSILLEEDPLAIPDHRLIREITNEFPTLLK